MTFTKKCLFFVFGRGITFVMVAESLPAIASPNKRVLCTMQ